MIEEISCDFNFYSDVRKGQDPDRYSPTLRAYHKALWSKELPNDKLLALQDVYPSGYLRFDSDDGVFELTSDAITHSYKHTKRMAHVIEALPVGVVDSLFAQGSTIGGYILFPKNKEKGKQSINQARGCHKRIEDRFDLTLECIRRFYSGHSSPLEAVFQRHEDFFSLFHDFKGYVDFFLLQDLVSGDYKEIKIWLGNTEFDSSPLPKSVDEYLEYRGNVLKFIESRNERITNLY